MDLETKIIKIEKNKFTHCEIENNIEFNLIYGRYICKLRKGNPKFICDYLESNHFIILHFCNYRK